MGYTLTTVSAKHVNATERQLLLAKKILKDGYVLIVLGDIIIDENY